MRNPELEKFVADPRYASLTPEQRADAFSKLEPRFGQLPEEERTKFVGMAEQRWRAPVGSEQTGLPGPLNVRPAVEEVAAPGLGEAIADSTVGAIGRGVIRTGEGVGGVMRYAGMEKAGKAVADTAARYSKPPKWLEEVSARPDRLTDPLFITNLAFEGAGSSAPFLAGGLGAGAVAARLPVGAWGTAAKWAAGTATGAVMESLVDAGTAFNEAIDVHKASPEAAAAVFTETVKREIPTTLLTNALGEFAPRMGGSIWKRALQVGVDMTMEGGEEVAQGVAQRSAKNKGLGTNTPLMEGAPEEFIGGALGGGIMSGVRALDERINAERQTAQPADVAIDPEVVTGGHLPAGEQRALPKPTPGRTPAGDLPPGQYEMGAARGNRNPVGDQGPFAMPGDAPVVDAEFEEVPPRQIEGREQARLMSPQIRGPRGNENPTGEQGPFYGGDTGDRARPMPGEGQRQLEEPGPFQQGPANLRRIEAGRPQLEAGEPPAAPKQRGNKNPIRKQGPFEMPGADVKSEDARKSSEEGEENADPWNSFTGDLISAGVNVAHMAASFKKNYNLDLEKEVREGRFGTDKIGVDELKGLRQKFPQKGTPPKKTPAVDLEGALAGSLKQQGIEPPAAAPVSTPVEEPSTPVVAPQQGNRAEEEKPATPVEEKDDTPPLHIPREQNSVVSRVMSGLDDGNAIDLERIAEGVYGAKRTSGAFSKRQIYEAQEAGMNAWQRDNSQRIMSMDPKEAIGYLRAKAKQLATQTVRDDEQVRKQQFSTPPHLAYLAQKVAGVTKDDSVLEPSGGVGGLVSLVLPVAKSVHLNEIDPERAALARQVGFEHQSQHDGELINALLPADVKPSVVIMNPPFSAGALKNDGKGANKNRSIFGYNHVEQALQRLQPGGRLVAILSGGMTGRGEGARLSAPQAAKFWQRMAKTYNIRANVGIPGKEYSKYGTSFPTQLVIIDKNGATPGGNWLAQVAQAVKGDFESIEAAWDALSGIAADRGAVGQNAAPVGEQKPGSGVAPVRGGVQPSGGERTGDAGVDRPAAGVQPGQRSPRPDAAVRSGDKAQPDRAGEPGPRHAEAEQSPAGGDRQSPDERGAGLEGAASLTPEQSQATATIDPKPAGPGAKYVLPGFVTAQYQKPEKPKNTLQKKAAEAKAAKQAKPAKTAEEEPEGDVGIKRRAKANAKEDTGAFVIYEPTLEGKAHPGAIVESKSMATVSLPPLTYEPKLPAGIDISAVQLESVVITGQQNERRNGDGSRGAALIGDGTGVGKGRTVAAMVLDNWNHGRKRIIWVSEKWDLIEDAKRDLAGIGAGELADKVVPLSKLDNKGTIELPEGVVFATYDLLRSKDKQGKTTVAALDQWLKGKDEAEGAFVAFDEAHEMKNTVPAGRAQASQMGLAAKKLRDGLPNLRTVYMSATSATEVENMGYLERLGLWGPRTPFPNGFADFVTQLSRGGIATMELIARELKATGKYIARTLSYKGVQYDNVEAELNPDQREIYRKAATAWRMVTKEVEKGIETVNGGREARSNFMSQYWSANQRFFNLLLTALKVPAAIELAERGLAQDKSIVITLQNTNEAAQNRQEAKLKGEEDGEPDDLDFGPKDILVNLVMEHYPVQQWVDEVVVKDGKETIVKVPATRKDESGRDVPLLNPQAIEEREELVKQIERDMHMPANPLDILIEHFGRDNVAELTGRSKYYDQATGTFVKRGGDLPRKKVNIAEAQSFQDGTKRVAILSQAAGTGISLHASNGAKNQQQRWHVTLQAGWSADKAMQMLGRTHRTNQKHTPHYFTLVSDMSGEKRFLATIAKRMSSLGALTRGAADASGGADMSGVNYESQQGQQAAQAFVSRLEGGQQVPGADMGGFSVLREMGLTKKVVKDGMEREEVANNAADVRRILNRLLALDPDIQNKVFEYYHQIFEAAVSEAMEQGTLDTGVKEFQGDSIEINENRVLSADPETGAETQYYRVTVNEKAPVASLEFLEKAMRKHPNGTFYVNTRTNAVTFTREAEPIVSPNGQVREAVRGIKPANNTWTKADKPVVGPASVVVDLDTLIEREVQKARAEAEARKRNVEWAKSFYGSSSSQFKTYQEGMAKAEADLAEWKAREADRLSWVKELWEKQYADTPKTTQTEHHMIGGAVLRWWESLKQNEGIRLAKDSKTGERVVGAVISPAQIQAVLSRIAGGRVEVDPYTLIDDVLRNGTEYQLERGVRIRRGRVSRDQVVQITVPDQQTGRVLIDLGVIYEKGITPVYYLPTHATTAYPILKSVLAQFPVEQGERRNPEAGAVFITREDLQALKKPFDVILGSMGARIADLDAQYGTRLREMISRARNNGDVMAGTFLNRLTDAGLSKLTRDERMKLLDLLEGRATRAPQKVVDAYRVIRQVTDTVSQLAQAAGLGKATSYFPHVYRRVEELASGPIRKDVIANLIRIKASPDERHATKFLEHYLTFKRGGKIHSSLSQWVIRQGQAATVGQAEDLIREGTAGLPFYDPDPGRVFPHQFALMGEKIAAAAVWGADGKHLKSQIEVLQQDAGKDTAEQVSGWMKRVLTPREADTKENAVLRAIRAAMTWKLGLAFIPNATQAALNIPMGAGLRDGIPVLLRGYRALFSEKGRRFAIESGAAIDPVLAEAHQDLGGGRLGRFSDLHLKPMQVVEQHNRIVAAAAGASLAQRLFERAKGNPLKSKSVRTARARLRELGIDPAAALQRGSLNRYDLQMAGKVFSDLTQFRSRAEMLPAWASTPAGKVAAQFKTFAYQQARFLVDSTLGELREGRPGNATFALLWAAVVGAGLGEPVRLLRNLLAGRQEDIEGWERFAKNIASVGAAGMMLDAVEAIERKDASRLAPPAAGTAADLVRTMGAWLDGDGSEATKKLLYRHAPGGQLAKGAIER